jgi:hypothetical protein
MKWLVALFLMIYPTVAVAQVPTHLDGREYIVDKTTVTVQWDFVSGAQAYQARLCMFDKDPITYFATACVPGSEQTVTFTRPRSGHFWAEVRATKLVGCDCTNPDDCSRWAESKNKTDASVDGLPMGWWIYWKTPKPIFQ